jgi:eukaryotic-like serine/threonine-protein kinase
MAEQRQAGGERTGRLAKERPASAEEVAATHPPEAAPGERAANATERASLSQPGAPRVEAPHLESPAPDALCEPGLSVIARWRYEVQGELGRGGLGRVSQAIDKRLNRPVAVKEILRDQGRARERFLREALITARLQHPGIVPIYEAGQWPTGEAFYTMKLIAGKPFDRLLKETRTLGERLALLPRVLAACEAVAYAHNEKIIHRDLKPHNILCGEYGETIVIDWGLAKDLRADAEGEEPVEAGPYRGPTAQGGLTRDGEVMGTPAYMPLEQAQGKQVDERADVYALGAILYQLLAGSPPYCGGGSAELLVALLAAPPAPLEEREPSSPRELSAIVKKATARAPEGRYPSAKELADDLRKFQAGQLVLAHRYTAAEHLRRWLRRHKAILSVAALALIVLGLFAAFGLDRLFKEKALTETERARAEIERATAKLEARNARAAEAEIAESEVDLLWRGARAALQTDPRVTLENLKRLSERPGFRDWGRLRTLAAAALAAGVPEALRASPRGPGERREALALSPDGAPVAMLAASEGGAVALWDLTTGRRRALAGYEGRVTLLRFSPDGALLAAAGEDKTARLWDLRAAEAEPPRIVAEHGEAIEDIAFSPDGRLIASLATPRPPGSTSRS